MTDFIRRSSYPEGFANIPQAVFRTEGMSYAAIGLLSYLLSLPPDWIVRDAHLRKKGGLGRDGLRSLVRELEAFGWLRYTQEKYLDGNGRLVFGWKRYEIYDLPKAKLEITGDVFSVDGNGTPLLSTKGTKRTQPRKKGELSR